MGTAAIAIILRNEKDVVEHFRQARALSRETAKTLSELGVDQGIALRRLRERAVIREGDDGALYLDEPSWMALGKIRHRLLFVILGLALAAGALWFLTQRAAS